MSLLTTLKSIFGFKSSPKLTPGGRVLRCVDCSREFIFDAGEQQFDDAARRLAEQGEQDRPPGQAHVATLVARARETGVSLDGTFGDEASVYCALRLAWVPPELREGNGELEAAAGGTLPRLVAQGDLRGFLHCHSNYSDGTVTIAEWAAACRAAGYEWVGITDHSKSAAYSGGTGRISATAAARSGGGSGLTPSC